MSTDATTSITFILLLLLFAGGFLAYNSLKGAGAGGGDGAGGGATNRPFGGGAQPGSVNIQPGQGPAVLPPGWLTIFLNTWNIALDVIRNSLDESLRRRNQTDLDDEHQRRLRNEPEHSIKERASDEDTRRKPTKPDEETHAVDDERNRRVQNSTDVNDRAKKPPEPTEAHDRINNAAHEKTQSSAGDIDRKLSRTRGQQLLDEAKNIDKHLLDPTIDAEDANRMRQTREKYTPGPDSTRVQRATNDHISTHADAEVRARSKPPVDHAPAAQSFEDQHITQANESIHSKLKPHPENLDAARSVEAERQSKLGQFIKQLEARIQAKRTRGFGLNKRVNNSRTVIAEIVEPRVIDSNTGKAKRLEDMSSDEIRYNMDKAGPMGHTPSDAFVQHPIGKSRIAGQLSAIEAASRAKSAGSALKSAAVRVAKALVIGLEGIGFALDVLQIVQVVGNSVYYDPNCGPGGDYSKCKFPDDLLSSNQVHDVAKLSLQKQIEAINQFTPSDANFKPKFPVIYGPLDTLNRDPYENQALIELEVDAIQNKIFNAAPYRQKFVDYLGTDGVTSVIQDPVDALSYYASQAGLSNTEIDTVYGQAFSKVCTYHGGFVWQDTYSSGRIRYQCGYSQADCETNRLRYFTPDGAGNYAEWYTNAELPGLLPTGTSMPTFTKSPTGMNGMCLVTNAGIAALCEYYNGTYDVTQHTCVFSPAYCQSIGTCHNSADNTCYLPSSEMEALSFFYGEGGVREWIKRNGCTFVGSDAQKAQYAFQSVAATFVPVTLLFTAEGRAMLADAIKNARNWPAGLGEALSDPNVAIGAIASIVSIAVTAMAVSESLGMTAAVAVTAGPPGWIVAAALMVAAAITIAVTMLEAEIEADETPKADVQEMAIYGLTVYTNSSGGRDFTPVNLGFADGWVTRKLPLTKDINTGQICSAYQHYTNPSTCVEVSKIADYPAVTQIPYAFGGNGYSDYSKRLQCWKYMNNTYTNKLPDGRTSRDIIPTYSLSFDKTGLTLGDAYGYTSGAQIVLDGYFRVGSDGVSDDKKIWCMERRPRVSLFDSQIGGAATADVAHFTTNRVFTSRYGEADQFYPAYPYDTWKNNAASSSYPNGYKYQLVYSKQTFNRDNMWDTNLMAAIFTDTTVSDIRKHFCEQDLIKYANDLTKIDKRCFGYLNLQIPGVTWHAMSVPGVYNTSYNTTTGTVHIGPLVEGNADNVCAQEYGPHWEEDSRDLCYLNCDYGNGAKNDSYANISRKWQSDGATMCYKKYEKWEDNKQGHTTMTITKKIIMADYQGAPNDCPAGMSQDAGLCYKSCENEYPSWYNSSTEEYINSGHLCYKHHKEWENYAGAGRTFSSMTKPVITAKLKGPKLGLAGKGTCADNQDGDASSGICYDKCNSDETAIGPTCYKKNCPSGTTEYTAGLCTDNCGPGYSYTNGFCYADCPGGQHRTAQGVCREDCHDIVNSSGRRIAKMTDNGAGTCYAARHDDIDCGGVGDNYHITGLGTYNPTCYRDPDSYSPDYWGYDGCCSSLSYCICDTNDGWECPVNCESSNNCQKWMC
jgi:hypothetical protein